MFALFCIPWAMRAQEPIPYNEGFESMSTAADLTDAGWIWTTSHSGSFLGIATSAGYIQTGSKALVIDSWDAGSSTDYVIVGLPEFNQDINTLQITFSYMVSTGTVYVGYLTDANDASTFVSVQSFSSSNSYTTKKVELNTVPANAARIAIKYVNWYRCYIDDIEVKAIPSCSKPETVTATPAGHVTWTGEGTTWNLNYKASSDAAWTEVNGITAMSYDIPGLATNTVYSVSVQNVCEDNSTTDWTTATFTTLAAIPLVEPFASSSIPTGWSRYTGLLSDVMAGTATLSSGGGWSFSTGNGVFDNHAKANIYNTGRTYWLVAPTLSMQDNVQLSFDLALTKYNGTLDPVTPGLQEDDKFVVLITTDGGDSWTILRQWDNAGSEYVYDNIACSAVGQNVTIDLSGYAGQNIAVAFYGESTVATSGSDNNLHIDNVSIDYIPSCAKPTGLAKSNVAAHTVDLSWTSDASAWVVAYKASEDEEFTEVNVTENPYTLPGLTPETAYTAKVRANCGGAYSDWTNVVSFTTTVACPAPTGLTTVSEGYDATFSWTGSANAYDVAFTASAVADPAENIEANNFTETNYTQYDLELGDYYFWVRANCGEEDGYSSWAGPKNIHIGYCVPKPSSRDGKGITSVVFGTGDNVVNNVDETSGLPSTSPYYGDYSTMVGAVQAGVESPVNITYATGQTYGTFIWVDLNNDMDFDDEGEILYYGMSASTNPTTLNATITIPATQPTGDYIMRIGGADLAFDNSNSANPCYTGTWANFHDYTLRVLEAPSCLAPNALLATPTTNSAELSWTANSGETSWTVYYKKASDEDYVMVPDVTENPYNLPGLDDATEYEYYVVANCSETDMSDPSVTFSFSTKCNAIVVDADNPFIENFDATTFPPTSCWDNIAADSYKWTRNMSYSKTGAASAYSGYYGDIYLVMPELAIAEGGTDVQLTFWSYNSYSSSYDKNSVVLLNGDNETEIWTTASVTQSWVESIVDLSEYKGQTIRLAFKYEGDDAHGWYVDSVKVAFVEACPKPTNLTAQNPGSTSVALRWYVNGDETAWQISTGDDENPIDVVADDVSRTHTVIGGNIVTYLDYTLTGLDAETEYTVKVRANCGAEDGVSDWSNSVVFTTLASCLAPDALDVAGITAHEAEVSWNGSGESYVVSYRTAAYMNGIEEEFGSSIPTGWENKTGLLSSIMEGADFSSSTQWAFGSNNNVFDNHARINIYGGSRYGWLITPSLEVPSGATFTFDLALTAYSGSGAASGTCDDDRFVVLAYVNNAWTILREWNNSGAVDVYNEIPTAGETVTIDIADYVGQNVKFAFYGESTINNNGDNNLHIDNVAIGTPVAAGDWDEVSTSEFSTPLTDLTPETKYEFKVKAICDEDNNVESEYSEPEFFTTTEACPVPTVLTATATNNSAELGWTANAGESAWTVYYKKADNPDFTAVSVTENPYTVEPLDAATEYVFYVEANCSETETSEPSTTFSFTTPCEAQDITYTYDFEDAAPFICWTPIAGAAVVNGNSAHEGSNYLKFSGTTSNMIALPQFSNATNTLRLEFWTRPEDRTYPSCGSFSVGYMTDLEDASSFVAVATYAYNDWTSNIYEKKTVDFNEAPANAYIAMRQHDCAYNYYWYVDDVTVKEMPSCPAPTGLTVSYTGGDEATVSWTSEATAWNLDVNGTVIPVTENPYTLTDLTLATDYDVKVQAVCGSEVSEWTSTKSFTTDACMPAELTVVNYELTDAYGDGWNGNAIKVKNANCEEIGSLTIANGASASGTLRICGDYLSFEWKVGSYPGEASWSFTDANGNPLFSGTGSTNMATGDVIYTIGGISRPSRLVPANVASTHALLNWYENGEATTWQIMLNNDEEHLITTTNNPYALSGLTPETPYTYKVRSVNAGDTSTWSCSEGSFTTTACYTPSDLQAAVVGYQVALTWDAGSDETDWNIRYRKVGAADWNTATSDGEEYTFTGTPGSYEAGVQAVCAEGYESDWYSTQFTIDCHPVHLAYHKTACETYTWSAAEGGNGQIYTTSGTYFNPHADVYECEQVDTLYLTINNPVHLAYHKTACETYTWTAAEGGNGQTYTTSGTYYYPHADANQCEQVDTLYLTINNPVHLAYHKTECETYTWSAAEGGNGQTYATSGIYYYPHADANQCQQVDTLYLTINNSVHLAYHKTECETYTWSAAEGGNGQTYTTSGTYYYPHTDANQCQQVDTLYLTINNPVHLAYHKTECETYTWSAAQGGNGQTYTTSGTYYYPHADANQCQQVDTLYLTINNPVHQSYTVDACDSYKWVVGSWSQTYTTPGVKLHSHSDANGCTQVDTLHLTLRHSTTGIDEVTACNSYTWINGTTYTQSTNTPTYTLTNAAGCDSVVTLHLTVNHSRPVSYTITECDSYTWIDGITYNASTTATYSHEDVHGCTQVDTLYLTINYSATKDLYDTVCEGKPYYLNGFIIPGSENVEGDHTHTLNLFTINQCDSTVTLHLHVNICDETCGQPITDIDNNSYETMPVHRLCWMTSNLRTTRYSDGTTIPFAIVYSYPYDPNNTDNLMTFGRLYNWTSASKAAAATPLQGVCPDGWRLPTQAEFEELSTFYTETQLRSTANWIQGAGTNESGFNKQPGGFYNGTTGICERLGASAHFYTADTQANGVIYQISDYSCDSVTYDVTDNPQDGRSIRCVRDLGND